MLPGEPEHVPVSIRHYVDARFDDHAAEHRAEHRAVDAAAKATDDRLASVNEFRGQLNDQAATFVSRQVIDAMNSAMNARIDLLTASAQRGAILAGIASGVIGVVGGFILSGVVT